MKSRIVFLTIVVLLLVTACGGGQPGQAVVETAVAATIAAGQPAATTAASPEPSDTPVPVVTPTTEKPTTASMGVPTPPVTICDDFNDGILDRQRWLLDDIGFINEYSGVLNFRANVDERHFTSIGASATLLPVARAVKEVSFTATLVSYKGNVPAGVGVEVTQANGRDLSIDLGPGPQGPKIEISVCPDTKCNGTYEEYQHYRGSRAEVGKSMQFRVVWNYTQVKFYVNDILQHEQSLSALQLYKVKLYLYADPGSNVHVSIDDFCVTYAN